MRLIKLYCVKIILYIFLFVPVSVIVTSCEKDINSEDPENDHNWGNHTGMGHEETGDYTWDASSVIEIKLNGTAITSTSDEVVITGSNAVISKQGNYQVSGNLSDGMLVIDADEDEMVRVILKNASIHNSTGPAILVEKSRKTIINLDGDSQNFLSDANEYSNPGDDPNAALFSKSDLTIFGTGSLSVEGNFKDGITGKDGLIVKSGNISVFSEDDGIRGKDYLIVDSPNILVNSGGDGLKSDNEENSLTGQVLIYGGVINATTQGDGISAGNTVLSAGGRIQILTAGGYTSDTSSLSQKGIKAGLSVLLNSDSVKIDASDHAIDSDSIIEIKGGSYTLFTARAAIHSNVSSTIDGGLINIIRSREGFESKRILINDGIIRIISLDDCFSATAGFDVDVDDGSYIGINNGYLVLDCLSGDGIDSNGSIDLKGGKVIIHGPSSAPEVAVDFNKNFNITGGFLVGSGTNSELLEYPDNTSSQNSIMAVFAQQYPESTIFHISDSEGKVLLTFQPNGRYQSVLFTSPELKTGETYYLDIAGSSTGTNVDGLIEGGIYTPGSRISMVTISSPVTILDNLEIVPKL